jgi:hypothetical protein
MSAISEEPSGAGVGQELSAKRSYSYEFSGGRINFKITVTSSRIRCEEIEGVVTIAHAFGGFNSRAMANVEITSLLSDTPNPEGVGQDAIEPQIVKFTESTGSVSVVVDCELTRMITDKVALYAITDSLAGMIANKASAELNQLVPGQRECVDSSPDVYCDELIANRQRPVIELAPPGLKSEYWHELVNLFAPCCSCGEPSCANGVLMALYLYGESELIEQGISAAAAAAISDHPVSKFLRDSKEILSCNGIGNFEFVIGASSLL